MKKLSIPYNKTFLFKFKKLCVLFILLLSTTVVKAQNKTKSLSLTTGSSYLIVRDRLGSDFRYSGFIVPIEFRYISENENKRHEIYVELTKDWLNTGILKSQLSTQENHSILIFKPALGYEFHHKLKHNSKYDFWAGGSFGMDLFQRTYRYRKLSNGKFFFEDVWDGFLGISALVAYHRKINKSNFSLKGSIPIIGWLLRTPWAIQGDESYPIQRSNINVLGEGSIAWPETLQALTVTGGLERSYNQISYGAFIETSMRKVNKHRTVSYFETHIKFKVGFNF